MNDKDIHKFDNRNRSSNGTIGDEDVLWSINGTNKWKLWTDGHTRNVTMGLLMVKVGRFINHSATSNRDVINHNWLSDLGRLTRMKSHSGKKKRKHFIEDHKDHQQEVTHDDDNVDDEDDADDDDDHDDDYADGGYDDCEGGVYVGGRDSSDDDDDNGDDGDEDGTRSQHASNVSNETWRKRSLDLAYVKRRKHASFAKKCY